MNVRWLLAFFLLCLPLCASAQNDRVEISGGYSYTAYSIYELDSGPFKMFGYSGWDGSAALKLLPHLQAEADFTGGFATPYAGDHSHLRTYMGGPRVFGNFGPITLYGHALFGGLNLGYQVYTFGQTSFATAIGGGAEYWFTRHIGVRAIQFDYLGNKNNAANQGVTASPPGNHFRISTGVAFRFGR